MKRIIFLITIVAIFSNGLLAKSKEKDIVEIKVTIDKVESKISTYEKIEQYKDSVGSRYSYVVGKAKNP